MALEEGREVLAVPGPINSFLSLGTNALIQRGAKLVRSIEDICEELPWQPRKNRKEAPRATSGNLIGIELSLVDLLRGGPRSIDWLSSRCERSVAELLPCLTELSLKGWVADEPGGRYRLLQDPRAAAAEPG
jgi:DNA processing protein